MSSITSTKTYTKSQILKSADFTKTQTSRYLNIEKIFFLEKKLLIMHQELPYGNHHELPLTSNSH